MIYTNYEKRYEFAEKLIGLDVEVIKFLSEDPRDGKNKIRFYLPVPEYGIALVIRYKDE